MTTASLATKHAKEKVIAPVFESVLGWSVRALELDTDYFGTFSGEVERRGTPKQAAIAKAKAAAEQDPDGKGMASEGTIGPHPQIPFITSDSELMAFVDLVNGLELVVSHLSTEIVAVEKIWSANLNLDELAESAQLPSHRLIAKAQTPSGLWVKKGLGSKDELLSAIHEFENLGLKTDLIFQSDFRAMNSPSRMQNIEHCAKKLAERISSTCPGCGLMGFGQVGHETGAPCRDCGEMVTDFIRADIVGCLRCDYRQVVERGVDWVDPSRCYTCNP
ncbi:MAG: hypothetical protein RL224_37 [Actinomycetota bacterium]|jgi:hypothetical protein